MDVLYKLHVFEDLRAVRKCSREKSANFNCRRRFVVVVALIESVSSSPDVKIVAPCHATPSIDLRKRIPRPLSRPEKFTVENGKRIKRRADIKKKR